MDDEIYALKKQLRLQQVLTGVLALLILGLFAFITTMETEIPKKMELERLDIIENDGNLAISLSNSENMPIPTIDGKKLEIAGQRTTPGIIFFDGKGDEVGGMLFQNLVSEDGYIATRHLSFDAYKQDQTLVLRHMEENGQNTTGLRIQDRPKISFLDALAEGGVEPDDDPVVAREKWIAFNNENPGRFEEIWSAPIRMFAGKTMEGNSELNLHDGNGNVRLQLQVSAEGEASIKFLDIEGNIVTSLTPDSH